MAALLTVEDLSVTLPGPEGPLTIVDGVSYSVEPGTVFGVAGESGSGKTISALALLGLLPLGATVEGKALYEGRNLLALSKRELRDVRGREIAMVFQDPLTALHPMMSIGRQLSEHMRRHLGLSRQAARRRAGDLLGDVRIPDPAGALNAFPHQFSGGMRQRIAIAMALACEPKLLIADEPTTALDVTVQAGILRLLDDLRERMGLSVILITHDLGVMSSIAKTISVFYAGRVVEYGASSGVLRRPRHPYTRALLAALPHPETTGTVPLVSIPGSPPAPGRFPSGCSFHPRCAYAIESCTTDEPPLVERDGRRFACPVDPFRDAA
jgi:oligopeptide/dipeptide ABC transporter ATP-binding protein